MRIVQYIVGSWWMTLSPTSIPIERGYIAHQIVLVLISQSVGGMGWGEVDQHGASKLCGD